MNVSQNRTQMHQYDIQSASSDIPIFKVYIQKNGRRASAPGVQQCRFFNRPGGCWFGKQCRYQHEVQPMSQRPACRFYKGPGSCRNGSDCYFRHSDVYDVSPYKMDSPALCYSSPEPAIVSPKTLDIDDLSLTNDLTPSKEEICIQSPSQASSDEDNSALQEESGVTSPGSSVESSSVTCGECGAKFNTEYDESKHSDSSELENDPLDKHYMDMIIKMDKDHVKFLQRDSRFKHPTSCGVCGRNFVRSHALLCHIVGKIKSGKPDDKEHREFLDTIIMGFRNRDYGLEDEDECNDWLLLHFVDSYEGTTDSENDSIESYLGIEGLLGSMALGKHLHPSAGVGIFEDTNGDSYSDDEDDFGCPFEFDEDDLYELACQGIKPWDPEAGAALSVLYGF